MNKIQILFVGLILGALALPFNASADIMTIDFETDAFGARANGFSSDDAPGVSFSDTSGSDLFVLSSLSTYGAALFVGSSQDLSGLQIDFGQDIDYLTMDFGGDLASSTNPGDLAMLWIYLGATLIDQISVALDRDGAISQSITFGSIGGSDLFDNVVFGFTNPFGGFATGGGNNANVGTSEVVDNITFNTLDPATEVPEPTTFVLLLLGISLLVASRLSPSQRQAAEI